MFVVDICFVEKMQIQIIDNHLEERIRNTENTEYSKKNISNGNKESDNQQPVVQKINLVSIKTETVTVKNVQEKYASDVNFKQGKVKIKSQHVKKARISDKDTPWKKINTVKHIDGNIDGNIDNDSKQDSIHEHEANIKQKYYPYKNQKYYDPIRANINNNETYSSYSKNNESILYYNLPNTANNKNRTSMLTFITVETEQLYKNNINDNKNLILNKQRKQPGSINNINTHHALSTTRNMFASYDRLSPGVRILLSDTKTYTKNLQNNMSCLIEGTVFRNNSMYCQCTSGWHGQHCSIPSSVYNSFSFKYTGPSTLRPAPRRVINALIFNLEWELLEARMHELSSVVDMFVILESNYTMFGDSKPLRLLQRLRDGYLQEYHHKIVHVFLDHFPKGGKEDGWVTDRYLRNFIGKQWLKQLSNVRPDDIFIYTDADELPCREAIVFLKLHSGYGQPFGFSMRWSVFGFFWKQAEPTRIMAGSSVDFLLKVLMGNVYDLRTADYTVKYTAQLHKFIKSGGKTSEWYIGDGPDNVGWHCSWCLPPEGVAIKLKSAINADFPRWGDYPEKVKLPYISHLIKSGTWFDDTTRFGELVSREQEVNFAPKYIMQHFWKYKHLLDIKYSG